MLYRCNVLIIGYSLLNPTDTIDYIYIYIYIYIGILLFKCDISTYNLN